MESIPLELLSEKNLTLLKGAFQLAKTVFYFASNQPEHVRERVERRFIQMSKYLHKKVQDDPLRNDWFSENEVSNKRILSGLLEKTINGIINDSQDKKSEYIGKFYVNICLTSNSDIDEATAFSYLETIESLSWRQFCIIRLIFLYGDQKVSINRINIMDDIEEMPIDLQTRFYSISRDYDNLMKSNYISGPAVPQSSENKEPCLPNPGSGLLPNYILRLHALMNLDELPIEDIVKTFSIWNVKLRQSDNSVD